MFGNIIEPDPVAGSAYVPIEIEVTAPLIAVFGCTQEPLE